MYSVEIITPPTELPVSVEALKLHLRLNDTAEDDLLEAWILAAADVFHKKTRYVLTETVFRMNLDGWPWQWAQSSPYLPRPDSSLWNAQTGTIYLPRSPVSAVASVQYLDTDGTWQTLAGTSTDLASRPARIVLPTSLPTVHETRVPKVRVQFTAGTASEDLPPLAVTAVKLLAAHWYQQREAYGEASLKTVEAGFDAICDLFRSGTVGDLNRGNHA